MSIAGLKAQNMLAQGNALGQVIQRKFRPERASQKTAPHPSVLPLQGKCSLDHHTQGAALGYHCDRAFSAAKSHLVFCGLVSGLAENF
jgi:hypothetical protein